MDTTTGDSASTFREAVAAEIRAHLNRHGISCRQLAAQIGMSPSKLQRRLNASVAIDVDDVAAISAALGISPYQLMFGPYGSLHSFPIPDQRVSIN